MAYGLGARPVWPAYRGQLMPEGNGLSPLTIQRRYNISGEDLVLSMAVTPPETASDTFAFQANVNAALDVISASAEREGWKSDLSQKKKQLRQNKERLQQGQFDKDIAQNRAARSAYEMTIRSRRGETITTKKSTEDLQKFDAQIALLESAKRDLAAGIPLLEWQILCLEHRIRGEDEPPMPPAVERVLQLIELPEDVSIAA